MFHLITISIASFPFRSAGFLDPAKGLSHPDGGRHNIHCRRSILHPERSQRQGKMDPALKVSEPTVKEREGGTLLILTSWKNLLKLEEVKLWKWPTFAV